MNTMPAQKLALFPPEPSLDEAIAALERKDLVTFYRLWRRILRHRRIPLDFFGRRERTEGESLH